MKNPSSRILAALLAAASAASAAEVITYTNFVRQVQLPSGVTYDATNIDPSGSQQSPLEINPGGARFELWTVKNSPVTNYLLDTEYVGSYVPMATVTVRSEDPYSVIPRTRADRPFYVDYTVSGILSGASDPAPSKGVTFLRHTQSYGTNGTGVGIDRTQATLYSQASITANGSATLTYALSSIAGTNRAKLRGEERFSIFSLPDNQNPSDPIPANQLSSKFIQIWPVADGSITGITSLQLIRFSMPTVTLTINDIYPESRIYAQVYKGNQVLGTVGTVVPGSSLVISDSLPQNRVLTLSNYDSALTTDGRWTMELLTVTPFGTDRLAYVSFDLDRTIEMNGTFTTIE